MADETPKPKGNKPDKDGSLPNGGMLDKWAVRSAGLPRERPIDSNQSEKEQIRQFYRLGGMSVQIVGTVVVFTLIGYWLDKMFGWGHTATITLAAIALVGSTYLFIKEAFRINK